MNSWGLRSWKIEEEEKAPISQISKFDNRVTDKSARILVHTIKCIYDSTNPTHVVCWTSKLSTFNKETYHYVTKLVII